MPRATVTARDEKKVEVFGPYEVYERIGVGGMASVHRAKKRGIEGFERVVALKRMLSHLADDESFIKSFVREARLASQLQHANIIQIYDLGRVGRVYYIAMEFVRGRDLRKLLKQTAYATGPMPVAMILTIARQLCDALDYAHSLTDESGEPLGIVHRDISPSNLLIAADGHLKIIDFGIAKATSASLRTLSGRVKGKFAYMPPESIHGKPLDNRSDIFSMGIVIYELLTARPLFASKNQFEIIRKITQEEVPPPSRYNPECPPDLDQVVMAALAKTPEERWQTAGAMHRALDHVAKRHGLQATNREIAEWLDWAFEQPLQPKRVVPRAKQPAGEPDTAPDTRPDARRDMAPPDPGSIEAVWGGGPGGRRKHESGLQAPGAETSPAGSAAEEDERSAGPPARQSPTDAPDEPRSPPLRARGGSPQTKAPAPASAGGTASGTQSTMLGVAPPPEGPWKHLRDSDANKRMAKAAQPHRAAASTASEQRASGSISNPSATLPVGRMGFAWLRIALLAIAGLGLAAGGYLLVTYWPAMKAAATEAAATDGTTNQLATEEPAAAKVALAPPDAARPTDAAGKTTDAGARPGREQPAAGSPVRISADQVTRTAGKPPRVRRSQATDDDGNPVVVHAELCIDIEGKVTSVRLDDPPTAVRRRVRAALEAWRYEPFRRDGEAVAACFEIDTELRDH